MLKPRVYDLLRFGSAAFAVLGLAALVQAVIAAQRAGGSTPHVAELEAQPRRRSPLAFVALGVVLTLAAIGAVTAASGGLGNESARPDGEALQTAAVDRDAAQDPAEESTDLPSTADVDSYTAKTDARGAVSAIESCYTNTLDYSRCLTRTALGADADRLMIHEGTETAIEPGEVLLEGDRDTYSITSADSKGFLWLIVKRTDGSIERLCQTQVEGTLCRPSTW